MRLQSLRRIAVLAAVLVFGIGSVKPSQAQFNLFSTLTNFFKKPVASISVKEKISPALLTPSVDLARWNERLKLRDSLKDKLLAEGVIDHILLPLETGLDPTNPDVAYDPTNHRYLVVYEKEMPAGVFNIMGQLFDQNGTASGSEILISSPRTSQHCFYANFNADSGLTDPPTGQCQHAGNPAVAYNNGRFLVTWELQGYSDSPDGKRFSNIIAKMVNANDTNLGAVSSDWNEGIMISRVWVASNVSTPAANDGQIQGWAQAFNPDVAPKPSSDGVSGFLVTWQSDRDYIGCVSADRRGANSIFGRYINESFSPTGGSMNKPHFTVFTHPMGGTDANGVPNTPCTTLDNVFSGQKPRIVFNTGQNGFVVAFEFVRAASATKGDIAAKRVTLDGSNNATVNGGSMMPAMVATASEGTTFRNADLASFGGDVILAYDDGSQISLQKLNVSSGEVSRSGMAANPVLGGSGPTLEPRIAANVGIFGDQTPSGGTPSSLLLTYTQGGAMNATVLTNTFAIQKAPAVISRMSYTANHVAEASSDQKDFFVAWAGTVGGVENIDTTKVAAQNVPPPTCTWNGTNPITPPDMPTMATQWAPTRLFMDWNDCTPTVSGDTVKYDVYYSLDTGSPAALYKSGISTSNFVIQASTDNRAQYIPDGGAGAAVPLSANQVYKWKICARNSSSSGPTEGASCMLADRTFRTDDSVVGWWRFDENPDPITGLDCAGGAVGEKVCDYSGKNNHGVPSGGPVWIGPMPDILNHALQFDGADDLVTIQNDSTLNPVSVSLQAKIKILAVNMGDQDIIDKRGASGFGYDLRVNGNSFPLDTGLYMRSDSGSEDGVGEVGVISLSTSYIITGTYNNITKSNSFYRDGVLRSSHVIGGAFPRTTPTTSAAIIGDRSFSGPGPHLFNGIMDEVIVYSKELDLNEVSSNFNATN